MFFLTQMYYNKNMVAMLLLGIIVFKKNDDYVISAGSMEDGSNVVVLRGIFWSRKK